MHFCIFNHCILIVLLRILSWNYVSFVTTETLQAPRFIMQPSSGSRIVIQGAGKVLQCHAIGYPIPVYKWLRDGRELDDFSPERYFKIHAAKREDAGSYQCIAKNSVGSILSQKVDITVAYMGEFSDLREKIVTVEAGQAAILDLPAIESYPEPLVTWQTDQTTFSSSNLDIIAGITHQLIILSASENHQKSYRAHVTNTQLGKDEFSPYIRLIVRGGNNNTGDIPPQIIVQPSNQNIIKGKQSSDLHCFTNARPLYSLETVWLKDGIPVENAGISYHLNDPWNRTLSLYNANLTHTGKYSCIVKLRNSIYPSVEAGALVTVLEPPLFTNNLRQETLVEFNSVVKLTCDAIGIPVPNIKWYRDAVDVSSITHHNRYSIEEGSTLVIKKLTMEDSGLFQCIATNEAGSDFLVTWLKVKAFAPIMENPPQNVTTLDGRDVILTCRATGAPNPSVTWFYNDTQPIKQMARYQFLEQGDLLITGVSIQDAGKYSCIRTNEAGTVNGSAYLSVLVQTQIIQPPANTSVLLGHDATFKCKVSGDPTIRYQMNWFHNNRPIASNSQRIKVTVEGTLEIHAVRPSDMGDYTCVLNSPGGNDTRTAKLNVVELPFSPTLVQATRVDHRGINVSWVHAFNGNSPILKYIIQQREVPDLGPIVDPLLHWMTQLNNVSASVNSVVISNLKAASSYQFRLSAVNSVGEGPPSEPSNIVQLPQEPPSGAPIGFAGSARSATEIITQWQPPSEDTCNGRILGYMIQYRLYGYNDSPWTYQNITNEAQRSFLITELITWKDYIIQIAAYNEKGVGVYSNGIQIKTKEGETLQAPRFIMQPSSGSRIVIQGAGKVLQCHAIGYPIPVYKWLRDGRELDDFSPERYFKIHAAKREDAGSYQCIAKNSVGSILSQKVDITVAYMGEFSDLREKIVTVEAGQAAILDLPAIESYPEPLVTWQTDQTTFSSSNLDIIAGITHQLIILSASENHQKSYRAHVTNTQLGKDEFSPYIRLIVRGGNNNTGDIPPQIIVQPSNQNIIKGKQSSDLHCFTNARPLYSLETVWLKDGIPVENAGISYHLNDPWNRTLSLYNANLTHTGKYSCIVKLRNSIYPSVEAGALVTVLEPPLFTNNLRQETLVEFNSVVKLTCDAIGIPVPNIKWYRDAVDVSSITHHNRYSIEEGSTLVIKKLTMEDSGLFQCIATNEAGSDFLVTWLKVKAFAPIMENPPQNVTTLDGRDVILTCRATGAPNPSVTWFYNDTQPIKQMARYQFLEQGDLLITGVSIQDAGKYSCIRTNEAGTVNGSAYLSVLVQTQIIQPPANTSVLLGHDATFKCKVSGDPTIRYQMNWFHNNRPIASNSQRIKVTVEGTLEIHAVRPSDMGDYTCVLNSPGGNDTRTAKLNVVELPFSPTLVQATRVDHRGINVSWVHAFNGNSPILKYIIQQREVPDLGPIVDPLLHWMTQLNNVSASVNSVVISNLKAASSYQFRLSAVNSVGEGPPSEPSNIVQLPQEPPSGAPIGFAGSARSATEIITQWQPPSEDTCNGRILGYMIQYRLYGYNDSPWTYQNITNEAQRSFLITELITWKDYIIQIAAYNEKGVGVYSNGIQIKTKEGGKLGRVIRDNVTTPVL